MTPWHQPSIFDAPEAKRRRDAALARVAANTPPAWRTAADTAVRHLAHTTADFTTDDVWLYLDDRRLPLPPEPRALGPVMLAAAKQGLIEATDRVRNSARPICHASPKRVWRSRVNGSLWDVFRDEAV